jgi:hypothetical protein
MHPESKPEAAEPNAAAEQALAHASRRYMIALGVGLAATFALLSILFVVLDRSASLPAPALANSGCVDQKLDFLREHPPQDPELLVMGSSVAWRHFDGGVMGRQGARAQPLNGGFCGLTMGQSRTVAGWLLTRLPSVRRGLVIVAPQDFERCAGVGPAFDVEAADEYVFEHGWKWGFYFRYFDPVSLVRNIWHKRQERARRVPLDPHESDAYGGSLLATDETRELTYGPVYKLDGACFSALRELALDFQRAGRPLAVAQTPLHPAWKQQFDPDRAMLRSFRAQLEAALTGTGAVYWDGERASALAADAFTDAIHLRGSAARELTEAMARDLAL